MAHPHQVRCLILFSCVLLLAACNSDRSNRAPGLVDWEEPAEWMNPPLDEEQRRTLPNGCFSGLQFAGGGQQLDEAAEPGLEVGALVENSPAVAAGIEIGDRLLEARWDGNRTSLDALSDWREIELQCAPGTAVELSLERGSREIKTVLTLAPRYQPATRVELAREREDLRAGVLLREASEVEARAAGLPPGAGAVLIGMAQSSPWKQSPLRYGDLLTRVNGERIDRLSRLLNAIHRAKPGEELEIEYFRAGASAQASLPLSSRERGLREVRLPLVFGWSCGAERTHWWAILGLIDWESTPHAWQLQLFWWIRFQGGDNERLEVLE